MKKILILLLILSCSVKAQTFVFEKDTANPDQPGLIAIPDSRGFINDRAHVFTAQEVHNLKAYMTNVHMDSTAITVLTINTLEPFDSLEQLATQYAEAWELGFEEKNGVLLVFSTNLKLSRIQVGDSYVNRFNSIALKEIDALMIPEFIKGDYYTGVLKALEKINELIN